MAQVDKLNYLPLLFWFIIFFILIYFLITVRIIPYVYIILKSRARFYKKLIIVIKKSLKATYRYIANYIAINKFLLTKLIRNSIIKYLN